MSEPVVEPAAKPVVSVAADTTFAFASEADKEAEPIQKIIDQIKTLHEMAGWLE